jgi:manganese efflux pump family protein
MPRGLDAAPFTGYDHWPSSATFRMHTADILFIALGLSMDALAVSLGAAARPMAPRATFRLSFHFGLFQCLMPIAGWLLGSGVARLVMSVSGPIACVVLTAVGGHMVYAGVRGEENTWRTDPSKGMTLVMLSVATSLDAFAIGFSLAIIGTPILYAALIIGIVTGALSLVGVRLGARLGKGIGRPMEIVGGVILIGIGFRLLLGV